ncbi:hypothetical protein AOC36_08540 [Erysipelothrix larvae]|uniref:Sulfatase N-terminal domain-containing protein n=1 Tax=Erysipelothrix larvae TaxID=1514105 RepID=A0A0X8H0V7_9FIRM|nr:LTA synthase family protein [Erysipelothrix larvae]AMC94032.1 hypothetical protein AOC36_08540 [Erysipelothrix larvae]
MHKFSKGIKIGLWILVACLFATPVFLQDQFGQMDFEQILFVMLSEGDGANIDIVFDFLIFALPYLSFFVVVAYLFSVVRQYNYEFHVRLFKKQFNPTITFQRSFKNTVFSGVCIVLSLALFINGKLDISGFVIERMNPGSLYETYYVDPNTVEITFPQEKQNLIYIVLESMNNNFTDINIDGSTVNLIPNLEQLSLDNLNFSNSETLGGHVQARGLSWTVASLVGQTSGVPLQIPIGNNQYGKNGVFLPGITTLGEILEDNGYSNYFLMGSDGNFGGRQTYFETHGNYTIYDTKYLKEIGFIPEDYHVFWGMEDSKLFEFAKKQLLEISANDEPFNFSMLTVDSHYTDGYTDGSCPASYNTDYANAYECSDLQVIEFINWIQAQDFYENTTVIIVGDHNTMNNNFLMQSVNSEYTLYNTFMNINTAVDERATVNRDFMATDLFPTTLAALGAEIEGDKLGLGTNLFSNQKTLLETLGYDTLDAELALKSIYYENNFLRK